MAGAKPFAAVLAALRGCYAEVNPLETFIQRLRESGAGEAEVLRGDDAPCYRTFVGQCVVCVPRGARAIPRPFTFQQVGAMRRSHLRRARGGHSSAAPAEEGALLGARVRAPWGGGGRRGRSGPPPALGGPRGAPCPPCLRRGPSPLVAAAGRAFPLGVPCHLQPPRLWALASGERWGIIPRSPLPGVGERSRCAGGWVVGKRSRSARPGVPPLSACPMG